MMKLTIKFLYFIKESLFLLILIILINNTFIKLVLNYKFTYKSQYSKFFKNIIIIKYIFYLYFITLF